MSNGATVEDAINNLSGGGNSEVSISKPLVTFESTNITLEPNKYYRKSNISSSLAIDFAEPENYNIMNEYFVEFTTSTSGTTISLPSNIKWVGGNEPQFESGSIYQISVVNDLGCCVKFA